MVEGLAGFGLLVGHLLGDYILQNDWQAANKTAQGEIGHIACTIHCFFYTLAVFLCTFWWMPWWGLFACFLAHWPIDRFRLARLWMNHVSGQKAFAGQMGPWSVIVVDNSAHLLTLFLIALLV